MKSLEEKMEVLTETAEAVRRGDSDLSLIADLYILFMEEYPETETTQDFLEWLDEDTHLPRFFVDIFTKGQILKFISDWVNEKDIQKFMNWLKDEREDLWEFLNDPKVGDDEYF